MGIEMEKEKNIILMVIQYSKGNIYIILKPEEKNIQKEDQNMKENIIKINGTEKDLIKMEISFIN